MLAEIRAASYEFVLKPFPILMGVRFRTLFIFFLQSFFSIQETAKSVQLHQYILIVLSTSLPRPQQTFAERDCTFLILAYSVSVLIKVVPFSKSNT